jgi:hypothetical protein
LTAASVGLIWLVSSRIFAVDRCLDAGGSFNYAARECDLLASHPYQAGWMDNPWLVVVGLAVVAISLGVIFRLGRRSNVP